MYELSLKNYFNKCINVSKKRITKLKVNDINVYILIYLNN